MIADFLHDFYTMPINLVVGGVATVAHIRWYKAPAGAKFLPFPSAIFSHLWDNNPGESVPGEIGEVGFPRTWDPGRNPGYQGQCYRGDPSWFATGQLPALASITPSPCLCQIPPAIAEGGLVLGGSALGAVATLGCNLCPRGAQLAWKMVISGAAQNFNQFNGTWNLQRVSDCHWHSLAPLHGVIDLFGVGPASSQWQATLRNTVDNDTATYQTSTFDCLAGGTLPVVSTSGLPLAPLFVTVGPP